MKRTLHIHSSDQAAKQYDIALPGLLIGQHRLADVQLNAANNSLAAFQLAIRGGEQQLEVINLSHQAAVLLDAQPLPLAQPRIWEKDQQLSIGGTTLHWEEVVEPEELQPSEPAPYLTAAANTAVAGSVATTQKTIAEETSFVPFPTTASASAVDSLPMSTEPEPSDPFADLLSGPGTVPVGADPSELAHPFSINDTLQRNPSDPLAQLDAKGLGDRGHDQLSSLFK